MSDDIVLQPVTAWKGIKEPKAFDINKLSPNTARKDSGSGYRRSGYTNNPETE